MQRNKGMKERKTGSFQRYSLTGLEARGFRWNTGGSAWTWYNIFFIVKVIDHCHSLPKVVVEAMCVLETIKSSLDMVQDNWLCLNRGPAWAGRLEEMTSEVSSNFSNSLILSKFWQTFCAETFNKSGVSEESTVQNLTVLSVFSNLVYKME